MYLLNTFTILNASEHSYRYSRDSLTLPETILSHIGWVSLWSLMLAKRINAYDKVDFGLLYEKAVFHDIDEIITGDVPRTTKYYNAEVLSAFRNIEKESVKRISRYIGIETLYEAWRSAKDNSLEGTILMVADTIAVVYKVWSEILQKNNLSFLRVSFELESVLGDAAHKIPDNFSENTNQIFLEIFFDAMSIIKEANSLHKESLNILRTTI